MNHRGTENTEGSMASSNIEWTDETWNPVVGCTKVSPGCAHCYAETMAARIKAMAAADTAAGRDPGRKRHYVEAIDDKGRWSGKLVPVPESLADPLGWRKPRRVFVNSMSDLFHEDVPDEFIDRVFAVMAICPSHTFQILTKRAERMWDYLACRRTIMGFKTDECVSAEIDSMQERGLWGRMGSAWKGYGWPLPNVWLGVSAERQQEADERIPWLLKTPAAVRFVSAEPLLGPIDFRRSWRHDGCGYDAGGRDLHCSGCGQPGKVADWIIVGGESGPRSRPCDVEWIRSIVGQCKAAGVPVFCKQLGSHPVSDGASRGTYRETNNLRSLSRMKDKKGGDPAEWPEDLRVRQFPGTLTAVQGESATQENQS